MKNLKFILTLVFVAGLAALYLESCIKESAPNPLSLVSLKTDAGTALDGSTPATGIPLKSTFIATFDKAIDAASASS